MFNREDMSHKPTIHEISEYVNNELWDKFLKYLEEKYGILPTIEYSKCSMESGWNVKFKKNSKSICTLYPSEGYFTVLVVVGSKQKERFLKTMFSLSPDIQELYNNTREFNNQRWLMIPLEDNDKRVLDVKKIIELRFTK